jgi:hypothetical protein
LILVHRIHSFRSGDTTLSSSDFPKLVSLYIENALLLTNQQLMTFPVLETLTLSNKWSSLQFIVAPKLRNLNLIRRDGQTFKAIISALRRATVRPMSLSMDIIFDTHFPEVLALWPDLSELHLRWWSDYCILGPITTAALAGSRVAAPLCSSLHYLTVQVERSYYYPHRIIRRLKRIVKKRKAHGVVGLQHVMCVWDRTNYGRLWNGPTEVEWVDVL